MGTTKRAWAIAGPIAVAVAIGATGVGHAEATPDSIDYSMRLVDHTVVTTLTGGTFRLAGDGSAYDIVDSTGSTVLTLPTAVRVAGTTIPVAASVGGDGTVLELTPTAAAPAGATADEVDLYVQPVASPLENQRAEQAFTTQFGLATAVGGFVGTAAGVVIGAVVGCALGLPLLGIGCIPAAITGATLGGILGTIAVGGPALAASAVDLINTLQAPPGTTKWAS